MSGSENVNTTSETATPAEEIAPQLDVRPDEEAWTPEEVDEVRGRLREETQRLYSEINELDSDIADLLREGNDVAGDDQADTGSKTFSREHEMSLAASHRDMLSQTARALHRIEDGTYGVCENCGKPIGKARLQAFPRASLCVDCKQREERR